MLTCDIKNQFIMNQRHIFLNNTLKKTDKDRSIDFVIKVINQIERNQIIEKVKDLKKL